MRGFPGGSVVKNPPAKQEIQIQSRGQEDPLEEEMATHSSILAWEISWTEEPGGPHSMGSQRVGHDWATETHTHTLHKISDQWAEESGDEPKEANQSMKSSCFSVCNLE